MRRGGGSIMLWLQLADLTEKLIFDLKNNHPKVSTQPEVSLQTEGSMLTKTSMQPGVTMQTQGQQTGLHKNTGVTAVNNEHRRQHNNRGTQTIQTQAMQTQTIQSQAMQTQTIQTQAMQTQAIQTQAMQTQASIQTQISVQTHTAQTLATTERQDFAQGNKHRDRLPHK
ncbi:hypothetical protein ILYODFUR_003662 [Ilyodon furcidens]|uniref:Uncharacterized protein n=1 Tax=Ilyodon furcidens TaxID=33524 RepID=A0ABV0VDN3_9TELE